MDKIPKKITEEGREKLNLEIQKMQDDLKKLREEKALAYTATGDTWHDNPYFNELERNEQQLVVKIALAEKTMREAEIVDTSKHKANTVEIGSIFKCRCCYNNDQDDIEEEVFEIVGHGESSIEEGKLDYESPVAKNLIGHKLNDVIVFEIPAGEVAYTIVKFYKSWKEVEADR